MKKITILIFALVLLAVVAAIATAAFYAQESDDTEKNTDRAEWDSDTPLSADTEIKIKQDYLESRTKINNPDATVDNIMVWKYYGTNGNCTAVMMEDSFTGYLTVLGTEVIDDITIHYGSSNRMLIWENGNFHRLQEAYDKGLLTKDDLMDISLIPFYNL